MGTTIDQLPNPSHQRRTLCRLISLKAIQIKAVIKTVAGKYILPEGDELCKPTERASMPNAIKFLDDAANQDIRLQLEALVEKAQL